MGRERRRSRSARAMSRASLISISATPEAYRPASHGATRSQLADHSSATVVGGTVTSGSSGSTIGDVRAGDVVVTSGIDRVYPKGFVIGHVGTVKPGSGLYKAIQVDPAVDFSKLEDVLVVIAGGSSSMVVAGGE